MFQDIELALRESTARWKIVVGHHAIRSIGHHGDTQELMKQLLPVLQVNIKLRMPMILTSPSEEKFPSSSA